jgi:uncharacterized integral membrane protein
VLGRGGNYRVLPVAMAIDAIISVQNATPEALTFLFWKTETAPSVVIFLLMRARILVTAAAVLSRYLKRFFKIKIPNHERLVVKNISARR